MLLIWEQSIAQQFEYKCVKNLREISTSKCKPTIAPIKNQNLPFLWKRLGLKIFQREGVTFRQLV